jgi:hypothetical protein
MTDDEHEYRRKNDVIITKLQTTVDDFIKQYDRDIQNQNKSLEEIKTTIQTHDEFIRDIKPIYAKGMIALGAFALGSIGISVAWFWRHINWNG